MNLPFPHSSAGDARLHLRSRRRARFTSSFGRSAVIGFAALAIGAAVISAQSPATETNLLKNGDFSAEKDGKPAGWRLLENKQSVTLDKDGTRSCVRVEITADAGKSHGQLVQKVSVKPNTKYRLDVDAKADKGKMGYGQIKLLVGGSEGERISTGESGSDWKTLSKEFATGNADAVNIVLRYRQSTEYVGGKIWFSNARLVELGPATAGSGPAAAPAQPKPLPQVGGSDRYVTAEGAGTKDGSSWQNAMAAASGGLQAAWDQTGPGKTLSIGSGDYSGGILIKEGGAGPSGYKKIVGVDTGGGLPHFKGNWNVQAPDKGPDLIRAAFGASYISVANLRVSNYRLVFTAQGRNVGLRISNLDCKDIREGVILIGAATAHEPAAGTQDVVIDGCKFVGFTKRGVRIRDGVHGVKVQNCLADAGGKDYATEPFHMGFSVQGGENGVKDYDITFEDCIARNCFHKTEPDKYWNADGFCAERHVYGLKYIRCQSYDHTDGGWDDKSDAPVLQDCIAMRNKRNLRFWARKEAPAVLINCLSAYAIKRGGSGEASGLWAGKGGTVKAERSTFYNNPVGVKADDAGTSLELKSCIVAFDASSNGTLIGAEGGTQVELKNTVEYLKGSKGEDPQLVGAENKDWTGKGPFFDSQTLQAKGIGFESKRLLTAATK